MPVILPHHSQLNANPTRDNRCKLPSPPWPVIIRNIESLPSTLITSHKNPHCCFFASNKDPSIPHSSPRPHPRPPHGEGGRETEDTRTHPLCHTASLANSC